MRPRRLDIVIFFVALLISSLGHVGLIGGLGSAARNAPRERFRSMEFAVIEPPPPPVIEEPPPPEPEKKPPPPKPVEKIEIPEPIDVTPPPNTTVEQEVKEPPKPVFGISMSSVVGPGSGSGFSVRVGNTLMKDPEDELTDPNDVKPLPPKPVPLHKVNKMPKRIGRCQVSENDYSPEARAMGIEGRVRMRVEIRDDGTVGVVSVITGLGYGLDEAAERLIKTKCKFEPAEVGGRAVTTTITYTFVFVLED